MGTLRKLIGTKEFYKKVLWISVPIMIQNGITNFVGMLDNLMVGQIGTNQMSGVAIINQLMFVFNVCIFGGISGAGIFTSQFYGKGDNEGVGHTFRFKCYTCIFLTIAALLLFIFQGENLISLYLHEGSGVGSLADTLLYGKEYLLIMLFGLFPFAVSQLYASTLRECGETMLPMMAGVAAVFVNLGLNYILIFGHFGAPVMGSAGAAIATVISRFAEMGIIVVWSHRRTEKYPYLVGVYRRVKIPKELTGNIFIKGMPLMINEILWSTGIAFLAQCYALRGLEVVAAQNICSTIGNVFNVVYLALGSSVAIVIGQLLGAGKKEEAKEKAWQMLGFTVVLCIFIALAMALFSRAFPEIYKTEDSVKELATDMILITTAVLPFQAFTNGTYFTLRCGGKTFITFLFDSFFVWVFVAPLAFFLAKYAPFGILTVYGLVQATELIKCTIGFILVKKGSWAQNITETA